MTPSVFSSKLAAVMLREWGRTFPARGKVTRPPTAKEYIASLVWLPTLLGGPVRHWREVRVSFRKQAFFGGGGVRGGGGGGGGGGGRTANEKKHKKKKNKSTGPLRLGHLLHRGLSAHVASGHAAVVERRADHEEEQVREEKVAFFLVEFFFLIFPLLFFFVLSLFSSTHHPLYQERRTARCEACRVRKIILNSFALLERRGEKEGNSI